MRRISRVLAGATGLDQLVRMVPVAELVHATGGSTVLDVGSGSRGIARLLDTAWRVTAVDASFDDYGAAGGPAAGIDAVVGDVRSLPFEDGAFDVVIAVDLLEHVAPADRAQALSEIVRVAARRVVVACPCGEEALAADRRLAESLASPPGWLAEHLDNGFPTADELHGALAAHGRATVTGNEHVANHERLVRAQLSVLWFVPTRLTAALLLAAFRRGGRARRWASGVLARLRGRDRAPTYRAIAHLDLAAGE